MSIIFKTNVNVSEIFGKYLTPSLSKLFTVDSKSTFFEVTAATVTKPYDYDLKENKGRKWTTRVGLYCA